MTSFRLPAAGIEPATYALRVRCYANSCIYKPTQDYINVYTVYKYQ